MQSNGTFLKNPPIQSLQVTFDVKFLEVQLVPRVVLQTYDK